MNQSAAAIQSDNDWLSARLSKETLESLNDNQRDEIGMAMRKAAWTAHPVDIRFSVPWFSKRYYMTLICGQEVRSRERLKKERAARPLATVNNIVFFLAMAGGAFLAAISTTMIYTGVAIPTFRMLPFATMYLTTMALTATMAFVLVTLAMRKRKQQDGTPYNTRLLKVICVFMTFFWLVSAVPFWTQ